MTMVKVADTWIYSFGGAKGNYDVTNKCLEIERLQSKRFYPPDSKWESLSVKHSTESLCQQGVIMLNPLIRDFQVVERRYLLFGGVFNELQQQSFIFNENVKDFRKSTITQSPGNTIAFPDKFYYQQSFKVTDLPLNIVTELKKKKA